MNKSDLKTGMIAECKNGNIYVVMDIPEIGLTLLRPNGHMGLDGYYNDMSYRNDNYTIERVFTTTHPNAIADAMKQNVDFKKYAPVIYDRRDILKIKELEEKEKQLSRELSDVRSELRRLEQ